MDDQLLTRSLLDQRLRQSSERILAEVRKIELNGYRQAEALSWLRQKLGPEVCLPATRGWAASPDLLLYLYDHVIETEPSIIVELGSGVSTVVIAAALRKIGKGRLYSLDHERKYLECTLRALTSNSLTDFASVHLAPISPRTNWYDVPEPIASLSSIDVLIVDGPPALTAEYARYPALPFFRPRLAEDALVFLDDVVREEETTIAWRWTADEMTVEFERDLEKGVGVLRPRKPGMTKQVGPEEVGLEMGRVRKERETIQKMLDNLIFDITEEDQSIDLSTLLGRVDEVLKQAADAVASGDPTALMRSAERLKHCLPW